MDIIYRVKDWNNHFENNRTRDMKVMRWVPVPNKHDGDGYTELVDHKDGSAHLGIWLALLQVASKCSVRGTLLRDNGSPHTPKSLARVTRLPESMIGKAIERLCSSDIGWMEVVDSEGVACDCGNPAPIPHPTDYGREGKEGNGKEDSYAEDVVEIYNSVCTEMPRCIKLSDKRKKQINARIAEVGFDELTRIIAKCASLTFLNGKSSNGWTADLEWITKDSNFTKIREGKYDNKSAQQQSNFRSF